MSTPLEILKAEWRIRRRLLHDTDEKREELEKQRVLTEAQMQEIADAIIALGGGFSDADVADLDRDGPGSPPPPPMDE